MSVLKLLCPVKVFGLVFRGEEASLVALGTGSLFTAVCGSFVLYAARKELMTSLIMPGIVCTCSGLAFSLLGLANWRICHDARKNAMWPCMEKPDESPRLSDEEITRALKLLAGHFRDIFEVKIEKMNLERNAPIDIPLEFAYAFGSGLLKVLENRSITRQNNAVDVSKWELNVLSLGLYDQLKGELCKFDIMSKSTGRGIDSRLPLYPLYESVLNIVLRFKDVYEAKRSSGAIKDYPRIPMKRTRESGIENPVDALMASIASLGADRRFLKPSLPSKFPIKTVHQESKSDKVDVAKISQMDACVNTMMDKAAALNSSSSTSETKNVSRGFTPIKSLFHPSEPSTENIKLPGTLEDSHNYWIRRYAAQGKQEQTSESGHLELPIHMTHESPEKKESDSETEDDSDEETKYNCETVRQDVEKCNCEEDNGPPYLLHPEEEKAMKAKIMEQYEDLQLLDQHQSDSDE